MDERRLAEFAARARSLHAREELDATAVAVIDAFDAAGIETVLLKGPALARLLYREDEHRGYGDIDLLIAPRDLGCARSELRAMGFADASPTAVFGVEDVAAVQHSDTWNRGGANGPLLIDLHWRIPGCQVAPEVAWERLAATASSIELRGRRVPVLGHEGLALHLTLHMAQHGPDDRKAAADLERGIERWEESVWCAASELAGELDATRVFAAGLRLVPDGARLADRLGLPGSDQEIASILQRHSRPRGTFHVQAFREARGARERARVLRRSLLPTRDWIVRTHPWAAGGHTRLMAGYAAHVLSAPVWAIRAWRFSRYR